jgi:ERCC4-type nuclease
MIKVDSREPEMIIKWFKKAGVRVSFVSLPIGDICNDEKSICVERKTYSDFASSFESGHLYLQLDRMCRNYEYPFLFISGGCDDAWNWTSAQNVNAIAQIIVRFPKLRMAFFPNDKQLVDCVCAIQGIIGPEKQRVGGDFLVKVLCAFEGITPGIASEFIRDPQVFFAISCFLESLAACKIQKLSSLAQKELERSF